MKKRLDQIGVGFLVVGFCFVSVVVLMFGIHFFYPSSYSLFDADVKGNEIFDYLNSFPSNFRIYFWFVFVVFLILVTRLDFVKKLLSLEMLFSSVISIVIFVFICSKINHPIFIEFLYMIDYIQPDGISSYRWG